MCQYPQKATTSALPWLSRAIVPSKTISPRCSGRQQNGHFHPKIKHPCSLSDAHGLDMLLPTALVRRRLLRKTEASRLGVSPLPQPVAASSITPGSNPYERSGQRETGYPTPYKNVLHTSHSRRGCINGAVIPSWLFSCGAFVILTLTRNACQLEPYGMDIAPTLNTCSCMLARSRMRTMSLLQ